MTLFILLLVLAWERVFKMGDHWQLERYLSPLFAIMKLFSLWSSLGMTLLVALLTWKLIDVLSDVVFGVPGILLYIMISLLCIGAGSLRYDYREYLRAVRLDDLDQQNNHLARLTMIQGTLPDTTKDERLREIQNALIWINFRYYLAPIFWLVVMGKLGPAILMGYGFLRGYQGWLAQHGTAVQRAQTGVDSLLHCLDWVPARLAGIAYALLGHGEKALPAWVASLSDLRTSQYKVVSQLAQFALSKEPHLNPIETPVAAVRLAKKATLTIVIIVALLTIYGALA
ncbi:beta-lactamase regulator AmpE [Xenorhabdus bovienii]|uniref:Putative transmembrane protein, protease n=1 Tax=Xenorhabdus bovienii str. puntauvense TaxID=1398201 RepID=A0A077NCB0_XENBV|nr:beta-lactamase regulator AmpE [Xenorhabdus bovienii]MCG3469242.1 beta-lactamase regulator AmpE [Xenorhabdus bovienii]CDG89226.1 putative transmembrane protein, protease [Xenorhabdus bovienii str. feltiae France]CDG94910.1 putative transmembrane protein, protease [Xenorhabdus bovienii str. feltiae Florida]CDG95943.1 putative transmembrane protein, protease [Xenorhabdus bovienii str. puntauvense]